MSSYIATSSIVVSKSPKVAQHYTSDRFVLNTGDTFDITMRVRGIVKIYAPNIQGNKMTLYALEKDLDGRYRRNIPFGA